MNPTRRQLAWSAAIVVALLGIAAAREVNRAGINCKDELVRWVDSRGRTIMSKFQICE